MTQDEMEALAAAKSFMALSKARKDHAMRYWAYEFDAERFAHFVLTGKWLAAPEGSVIDAATQEPDTRGPEVGDVVAHVNPDGHYRIGAFQGHWTDTEVIVLMRRAEVEARMGGKA